MRELTPEEIETLDRRRDQLETFLGEREPALLDLAKYAGLEDANEILTSPEACIPAVDAYLASGTSGEAQEMAWVFTRVGYLIGDVLVHAFGGHWHLNEVPQSRTFTRFVVGRFDALASKSAVIDPFEVAHAFVNGPPGVTVKSIVDGLLTDLRALPSA